MLTISDEAFLKKRRWRVRYWLPAGLSMLALTLALTLYLWIRVPRLVNPYGVMADLQAGALDRSNLELAAFMLPIVVWAVLVLLLALIGFAFAAFSTEKRYLKIIDREYGTTVSAARRATP